MTTTAPAKSSKVATAKAAITRLVRIAAFGYASYKALPHQPIYDAVATAGAETFFRLVAPNTTAFWTRIAKLASKWSVPVAAEIVAVDPKLAPEVKQAEAVVTQAAAVVETAAAAPAGPVYAPIQPVVTATPPTPAV